MADPLSAWVATGAAVSVIQIVEFTTKLVKETRELMNSPGNSSKSNAVLEKFTLMHSNLADQLLRSADYQRPLPQSSQVVDNLAHECKEVSSDLLKLLRELKVTDGLHGPKRAFQSACKASRSLQKQKTIQQKQKYLSELTGQLSTAVLLDLRSTQLSRLEDVYNRVGEAETRNAALITESRDTILKSSKWTHDKRRYIIESLRFPEMHLRRDAIPEAYANTFSWLFTEHSPFRSWLTNSKQIFWITGKAGSGKSTAMKYIAGRARTKELLAVWAGSRKLVIAQNYMWNPGLAIQRNEEGMLQEILFHILAADPELANMINRERWQDELSSLQRNDNWTRAELLEALRCVFQQSSHRNCYCVFIDGLDEYEGEHAYLIDLILALSNHANVKFCISSRPWNVFRNAFEHLSDKIYVHELTQSDIRTYICGELGMIFDVNYSVEELISAIANKAKGVFFWVYLVVRSLREGFEEGDCVQIMQQRVDEFPADLEDYFKHMLRRLSKTYRKHTIQALSLAIKILGKDDAHRVRDCDSFLPFWLLSQGYLDKDYFAFDYQSHYATVAELQDMSNVTKKHLNACCKDFLFVTGSSSPSAVDDPKGCSLDHDHRVEFLHRTVYDFLHSSEMREVLDKETPAHFHDALFPTHVALIQDKVKGVHDIHFCQSCSRAICSAIKLVPSVDLSTDTMIQFEQLAVHLLNFTCSEHCCYQALCNENLLEDLCIVFASYRLSLFIEKVVERFPDSIRHMERVDNSEILRQALGLSSRRPFPTAYIDLRLLETLLRAGDYRPFQLARLARKLGRKTAFEFNSWTESDVEHVSLVINDLAYYGLDINVMPAELIDCLERYLRPSFGSRFG